MLRWQNITRRCMSKKDRKKIVPGNATSRIGDTREVVLKEPVSYDKKKPSWRFARFDSDCADWGLDTLKKEIENVLDCLRSYEDCTWQLIKTMTHGKKGKTKNHYVSRDGLTKKGRKRLNDIQNDDVEEVFSLRYNGLFRIIGLLRGDILYILWIDPNHEVCETKN